MAQILGEHQSPEGKSYGQSDKLWGEGRCKITEACLVKMLEPGHTEYDITHQILFIVLAKQVRIIIFQIIDTPRNIFLCVFFPGDSEWCLSNLHTSNRKKECGKI